MQLDPDSATQQFGLQVLGSGQSAGLLVDSGDSQVSLTPASIDFIALSRFRLYGQCTFLATLALPPVLSCSTTSDASLWVTTSSMYVSMISV